MEQRNMLCTQQMLELDIDQGQIHHLNPEPCILLGNLVDFPNNNIHQLFSATGPTPSLDLRHLPDHHDCNMFYTNPYNSLQHRHPVLGGSAPNFYNPYMVPSSSSRIGPVPLNHGTSEHFASSSSHGVSGVNLDEYGRSNHLMDNSRGSCKRKNAEGVPGNYCYVNGSAGSSSSSLCGPLSSALPLWEERFEPTLGLMEAAPPYGASEYRGNGVLAISEGGSRRSVRSRSSTINLQLDSVLAHHNNQIVQVNHMGRSFLPANSTWVEQFGSNNGDIGSSNLHYAPPMPYLQGRSVNGGLLEVGSLNGQGLQDPASSRNFGVLHPSSMHHHCGHHASTIQGMRGGHCFGYNAQVPAPSFRHPANHLHPGMPNSSRDGLEISGSRYPRTLPSSGDRIYRPHRRMPQTAQEDINGRMRLLSSEDVAILEYSGFYGAGNFIDQHRDMRLDIDDMSYEELLALEERIGDVNTGLSEQSIAKCLKTRLHSSRICSRPGQPERMDHEENGTCIICQVEYEEGEKIGTLDCGHDYHADCIWRWLSVKNVCPICKTSALSMDKNEGR
ncbi:probable E3 ubiquitin-protein ligase ZFP1 [Aristolochia californica]|uniref:probable E3 ubiquitin-protein ligase ZFP1 n=1 Tax=Aristolochia californica TaxID=171875 RepID=UPI0035E1D668